MTSGKLPLDENGCPIPPFACPSGPCKFCKDFKWCKEMKTCASTIDWDEVYDSR